MPTQKKRGRILVLFVLLGLIAGAAFAGYFYFLQPTRSTLPVVLIQSPRSGDQVRIGQLTLVHSIARSQSKITRIELWVDGQIQHSESSTLPGGTSPFPLSAQWHPIAAGAHTLTVRAFNSTGGRAYATVSVVATQTPDRDNDEISDASDACPDQPGPQAVGGCADRDGDGIRDLQDQCPEQAGVPANSGCPMVSEGDRDGDGLHDTVDACPDQVGTPYADGCPDRDGDGIQDSLDACPTDAGLSDHDGCPTPGDADSDSVADTVDECPTMPGTTTSGGCADEDGDTVRDDLDTCPGEAGAPGSGGCPDRDADSVLDSADLCPDVAGPVSNGGCPLVSVSDRDRDGLADDIDRCPDEPGLPEHAGCPPPGAGADEDDDGIADESETPDDSSTDDLGPFFMQPLHALLPIEFEALDFQVSDDYTEVYCYASLADSAPERYPAEGSLDTAGTREWDISEQLGGANTRHVAIPMGDPLGVSVECAGDVITYESDGAWGSHFDLGSIAFRHPISDFDGHVITAASTGGSDGRSFQVTYRICPYSCQAAEFRPPVLYGPYSWLANDLVFWQWEGDTSAISGYKLYVNGSGVGYIGSDRNNISLAHYMPPCTERFTYQLSAYRLNADGTVRESPLSNEVELTGGACPHTVRVRFERIQTGGDWGGRDEVEARDSTGPIQGAFTANEQSINFDLAKKRWMLYLPYSDGIHLYLNRDDSVAGLFDLAETFYGCGGGGCEGYVIPYTDTVTVNLGPYEDLTTGGTIIDFDIISSNETVFSAHQTIPAEELHDGSYTLRNGNITLVIQVEVLGED